VRQPKPNQYFVDADGFTRSDQQYEYQFVEAPKSTSSSVDESAAAPRRDRAGSDISDVSAPWSSRGLPIVDPARTKAKREYIQKYVDRHSDKIKSRPDLKAWLEKIRGSMIEKELEQQLARDFIVNCCQTCFREKWAGGRFCWNDQCSASPVFVKKTAHVSLFEVVPSIECRKRPRSDSIGEDSVALTDCEIGTPERNWCTDDLNSSGCAD